MRHPFIHLSSIFNSLSIQSSIYLSAIHCPSTQPTIIHSSLSNPPSIICPSIIYLSLSIHPSLSTPPNLQTGILPGTALCPAWTRRWWRSSTGHTCWPPGGGGRRGWRWRGSWGHRGSLTRTQTHTGLVQEPQNTHIHMWAETDWRRG